MYANNRLRVFILEIVDEDSKIERERYAPF